MQKEWQYHDVVILCIRWKMPCGWWERMSGWSYLPIGVSDSLMTFVKCFLLPVCGMFLTRWNVFEYSTTP
jgi:hypothetical protein